MNNKIIETMKILPIDNICPFEWNTYPNDLISIDDIQLIRHPFLVTSMSEGKYLLLEESEEYYNLKQAGVTQLPVQIIPNDKIFIQQEPIGLYSFEENDLAEILTSSSEYLSCMHSNSDEIEQNSIRLYLSDKKYIINHLQNDKTGCSLAISKLFEYFENNSGYRMLNNNMSLSDSLMKIYRFTSTIELPKLHLEDLSDAVQSGSLFPPSILKVNAELRILFIDYPISTLISDSSILEKEIFLRELISLREQSEKTSNYTGRVYLLNR